MFIFDISTAIARPVFGAYLSGSIFDFSLEVFMVALVNYSILQNTLLKAIVINRIHDLHLQNKTLPIIRIKRIRCNVINELIK